MASPVTPVIDPRVLALITPDANGVQIICCETAQETIMYAEEIVAAIDAVARTRASHCSCGRPAREVLDGGRWGPTAYCGAPFPPLDPCNCGHGAHLHDRGVCHIYGRGMAESGWGG